MAGRIHFDEVVGSSAEFLAFLHCLDCKCISNSYLKKTKNKKNKIKQNKAKKRRKRRAEERIRQETRIEPVLGNPIKRFDYFISLQV